MKVILGNVKGRCWNSRFFFHRLWRVCDTFYFIFLKTFNLQVFFVCFCKSSKGKCFLFGCQRIISYPTLDFFLSFYLSFCFFFFSSTFFLDFFFGLGVFFFFSCFHPPLFSLNHLFFSFSSFLIIFSILIFFFLLNVCHIFYFCLFFP